MDKFVISGQNININPAPDLFGMSAMILGLMALIFLFFAVRRPVFVRAILLFWLGLCVFSFLRYFDLVWRLSCGK